MRNICEVSIFRLFWLLALFGVAGGVAAGAEFIAEGVKLVPLTDDGKCEAIAWAPHGDLVAFVREVANNHKQVLVMKSDGSGEQTATPLGNPFYAQWSWKGDKLAYEFSTTDDDGSQGGIYVYGVASDRSISVSIPREYNSMSDSDGPRWSPDDQYVAYKARFGASRSRQVWVAEAKSGRTWRVASDWGQAKDQDWSFTLPARLCLLIGTSDNGYEVATVGADGRNLHVITDVGAQSIWTDNPHWSPTDDWVVYKDSRDMTQSERDLKHEDLWIARPDGTEKRNLTNAASPVSEEQLDLNELLWSWDGRQILATGHRLDKQGNLIDTLRLLDPVKGGYKQILTSYPRKTGEFDSIRTVKWSYDSSKIAILVRREVVKNWGPDADYQKPRWILSLYDVRTGKRERLLFYDQQQDRKRIEALDERKTLSDISWSPDSRSLLITIAKVISEENDILQPDVYRLDLPERLISADAARYIGPPVGRQGAAATQYESPEATVTPSPSATTGPTQTTAARREADASDIVTEVVRPVNMTVEEAIGSLSPEYSNYFTVNKARNILLFKGPPDVLASLRSDLSLIDTPAPHILVDLLAVELTEEANRDLGLDWTYVEGHVALFQPAGYGLRSLTHDGFSRGAADELSILPGVGQSFYQGVGTLPREFFVRLNTLVRDGEATILANPRTVSISGKESLIEIRKVLNYFFNEGFDTSGRPVVKKSDIASDTNGLIIPTLLPDGRIHLIVEVAVGSFTFIQDQGLPEQTGRKSKTEVIVNDGQTIVIGGLRQQEMNYSIAKVPIISDLPIIGPLFQREEKDLRNSVLTIFITPQLLKPEEPVPDWPTFDGEKHQLIPIMDRSIENIGNGNHTDLGDALNMLLDIVEE